MPIGDEYKQNQQRNFPKLKPSKMPREAPGMKRKDENLANPLNKKKQKKSNENSWNKRKNFDENTGNSSSKKQKRFNENSSKKRKKSDEKLDAKGNLANRLKKQQKEWGEISKRVNLLNQITIRVADHLWRWQVKKRSALLPPHHSAKATIVGKSIMEPSNNAVELTNIVDQALGIFHEEIFMEILIWLPVRSLLRSKCVSKHWKALISDPYFKRKHLNHAKNVRNFQKLFVARHRFRRLGCTFYCSSLPSSVQLVEDEQKLDFPWNWKPRACLTLCGCDGLVLLALYEVSDYQGKKKEHLLLWNPSTRESRELPRPKSPLNHYIFGMGYDTTSDDYKILAIDLNGNRFHTSFEILALKSGSWRVSMYLDGFFFDLGYEDYGMDSLAFLCGAFHWVSRRRYLTICSFNMSNEVCGEIPFLHGMLNYNYVEHGVSTLGGMLCLYSTYSGEARSCLVGGSFKLWVMKDYGVKESWTLLYKIQDSNLFSSARPRYMYADGEVLLCCRRKSCWGSVYRTSKGPFEKWPAQFSTKEGVYTESLISPKLLT